MDVQVSALGAICALVGRIIGAIMIGRHLNKV
jgi:hypothetical protein